MMIFTRKYITQGQWIITTLPLNRKGEQYE